MSWLDIELPDGRRVQAVPLPHEPGEVVTHPERPATACEYCGAVGECDGASCSRPTPLAVRTRRVAMEMQLGRVNIDPARLKDRSAAKMRTVEVIAHDVRKKLLERAESMLDHNDLDNAVTLINAAKGLT